MAIRERAEQVKAEFPDEFVGVYVEAHIGITGKPEVRHRVYIGQKSKKNGAMSNQYRTFAEAFEDVKIQVGALPDLTEDVEEEVEA